MAWPAIFNLSSLTGANGFEVPGLTIGGSLGFSVASAGDINADGKADVIIGEVGNLNSDNQKDTGKAYVIFGGTSFTASFNLLSLDGKNGFTISGLKVGDVFGASVGQVGDINNDGIDDIAIGAYNATRNEIGQVGEAYIIFGSKSFQPEFDLTKLNGSNGFTVTGLAAGDGLGSAVGSAGDINGDNVSDLVLGAGISPYYSPGGIGKVYIIFGTKTFSAVFDLNSINGRNGFNIESLSLNDVLGWSIASVGDINDDSKADLAIGVEHWNNELHTAVAYVIFGNNLFPPTFDLKTLSGSNGFAIIGLAYDSNIGAVAHAGDINNDGISDLAIGLPQYPDGLSGANPGRAYVVFGSKSFGPQFILDIVNGTNGFAIVGCFASTACYLGASVASSGDFNSDGIGDLAVSSMCASPRDDLPAGGEVFVIFGKRSFDPTLNLTSIDGSNGFGIPSSVAGLLLGYQVALAGDVNGDGQPDLIIGGPGTPEVNANLTGDAYVIFGGNEIA